ncbi:MAG: nuclear transport factor 2 family protein [Candidatus Binatia bacterium]
MASAMDPGRFEDYEAIKKLKARYFRFLDTKRWQEFGELFAEDAFFVNPETGQPTVCGRQAIVERVRTFVKDAVTVHHGHMPEIELTGQTTATAIWAMFDLLDDGDRSSTGYGHYEETYVKIDSEWKIRSSQLTRLHHVESRAGKT